MEMEMEWAAAAAAAGDDSKKERRVMMIAMKGHPGSGKSTLGHSIAATLRCPLVDKDHFRDCTKPLEDALEMSTSSNLLNQVSYEVMWRVVSAQLSLGLSVVIDSPLSRRAHLDRLLQLADHFNARLVIVECKPKNEGEWRRRLELRGSGPEQGSWHKPSTWEDMERLLDKYKGCWDYDTGEVPKLVVDTTAPLGLQHLVTSILLQL